MVQLHAGHQVPTDPHPDLSTDQKDTAMSKKKPTPPAPSPAASHLRYFAELHDDLNSDIKTLDLSSKKDRGVLRDYMAELTSALDDLDGIDAADIARAIRDEV